MVEPPGYYSARHQTRDGRLGVHTKHGVSELLMTFDILASFDGSFDITHCHHSTNRDSHGEPESGAVDGNDLPDILAIYIERCRDGLRLCPVNWVS